MVICLLPDGSWAAGPLTIIISPSPHVLRSLACVRSFRRSLLAAVIFLTLLLMTFARQTRNCSSNRASSTARDAHLEQLWRSTGNDPVQMKRIPIGRRRLNSRWRVVKATSFFGSLSAAGGLLTVHLESACRAPVSSCLVHGSRPRNHSYPLLLEARLYVHRCHYRGAGIASGRTCHPGMFPVSRRATLPSTIQSWPRTSHDNIRSTFGGQ